MGVDYARNRYYTSQWGRFTSPDPYQASGGPADPGSWNRYSYVEGDPVNYVDPMGLKKCPYPDDCAPDKPENPTPPNTIIIGDYFYWGKVIPERPDPTRGDNDAVAPTRDKNELLKISKDRVKLYLAHPECGKLFNDVIGTWNKVDDIKFYNGGLPQYVTAPDGQIVAAKRSPGVGRYNPFNKSISLLATVNWNDPDITPAIVDGKPTTVKMLAGQAIALGISSMTSEQFMDLIILHELSHYNGIIGNPDTDHNVEKELWEKCIK